jgi:hypothetical protein
MTGLKAGGGTGLPSAFAASIQAALARSTSASASSLALGPIWEQTAAKEGSGRAAEPALSAANGA